MAGLPLKKRGTQKPNSQRIFFVLPVVLLVAFNALIPMIVVNYSVQETFALIVFQRSLVWKTAPFWSVPCCSCRFPVYWFDFDDWGAVGYSHCLIDAKTRILGACMSCIDGLTHAYPMECRGDVEHIYFARYRLAWVFHEPFAGHYQIWPKPNRQDYDHVMDVWHWTSLVVLLCCWSGLDTRRLLPSCKNRWSIKLVSLSLYPVA